MTRLTALVTLVAISGCVAPEKPCYFGFTPTSKADHYETASASVVGAEAVENDTAENGDLRFKVPPQTWVKRVQGTLSFRARGQSQCLAIFSFAGGYLPIIVKLGKDGGCETVFVSYACHLWTGDGTANLHVEREPAFTRDANVEFQGMVETE